MKKKVILRAPLLTVSGYGEHSRQIFKWLLKREDVELSVQTLNWGNTSWYINPNLEDGLIGEIMKRSTDKTSTFDYSFQVQLPDEWDQNLAKTNIGVTAGVETDKCYSKWTDKIKSSVSHVIVPSDFTKKTFSDTDPEVAAKISVVPEAISLDLSSDYEDILESVQTKNNFLIISQLTAVDRAQDRKCIIDTIEVILKCIKDRPDWGIIIKTNMGRGTEKDLLETQHVLSQLKSAKGKIHLLHGLLTSSQMLGVYRSSKVRALVSMTRGEGFGLPLLEAAACDIPVFATGWSAHNEFLSLGRYGKIAHTMIPIPDAKVDDRIFMRGSMWAQPDRVDLEKKINKFIQSPDVPKQWALELGEKIREKYSQSEIEKSLDKFAEERLRW
jgi:glycosyltransferase involved in cell wall biosynthesis